MLVTLALEAFAGTLFVETSGSDGSADCSSASPCATLEHAVALASAGDTIQLGAGVWSSTAASYPIDVTGLTIRGDAVGSTRVANGRSRLVSASGSTVLRDLTLSASGVPLDASSMAGTLTAERVALVGGGGTALRLSSTASATLRLEDTDLTGGMRLTNEGPLDLVMSGGSITTTSEALKLSGAADPADATQVTLSSVDVHGDLLVSPGPGSLDLLLAGTTVADGDGLQLSSFSGADVSVGLTGGTSLTSDSRALGFGLGGGSLDVDVVGSTLSAGAEPLELTASSAAVDILLSGSALTTSGNQSVSLLTHGGPTTFRVLGSAMADAATTADLALDLDLSGGDVVVELDSSALDTDGKVSIASQAGASVDIGIDGIGVIPGVAVGGGLSVSVFDADTHLGVALAGSAIGGPALVSLQSSAGPVDVTLDGSSLVASGTGRALDLLAGVTGGGTIDVTGNNVGGELRVRDSGTAVFDLLLSGNTVTSTADSLVVFRSSGVGSVTVADNQVTGVEGIDVVYQDNVGAVAVTGNDVTFTGDLGIDLSGGGPDIASVTVSGNTVSGGVTGVRLSQDDLTDTPIVLADNDISGASDFAMDGVVYDTSGFDMTISGNTLSGSGVDFSFSSASGTLLVEENTVSGAAEEGLAFGTDGMVEGVIRSNTVTTSGIGIELVSSGTDTWTVASNRLESNSTGLRLGVDDATEAGLLGNFVAHNGLGMDLVFSGTATGTSRTTTFDDNGTDVYVGSGGAPAGASSEDFWGTTDLAAIAARMDGEGFDPVVPLGDTLSFALDDTVGSEDGGEVVTIVNTGASPFVDTIGSSTAALPISVRFDSVEAVVTYLDEDTLQVEVPAGAVGYVDVTVTNPGGQTGTLGAAYQYVEAGCDDLCVLMPDLVAYANASWGSDVVDAGAKASLQPDTLEARLRDMLDQLKTGGCLTGDTFEGAGGAYGDKLLVLQSTTGTGTLAGSYTKSPKSFVADLGATTSGEGFSDYTSAKWVGTRSDGGWAAGVVARVAGSRGVFLGLHGTCDGTGTAPDALEPWYGDLSGWP